MPKQIMIDIETLGTSSNCVVASIGATVLFGEGDFYRKLDWSQQTKRGRVVEPSTVRWWLQQGAEAQAAMVEVGEDVETVLNDLADFCGRDSHAFLWANGNIFDLGILRSLYSDFGVGFPTTYDKELDFRTVRKILEMVRPDYDVKWLKGETAHDALSDAKSQAHALENIFKDIFDAKPKAKRKPKAEKKDTPPEPVVEEPEQVFTVDDVRQAFKDNAANNGKDAALSILADFGASRVSDLTADTYAEVIEACQKK